MAVTSLGEWFSVKNLKKYPVLYSKMAMKKTHLKGGGFHVSIFSLLSHLCCFLPQFCLFPCVSLTSSSLKATHPVRLPPAAIFIYIYIYVYIYIYRRVALQVLVLHCSLSSHSQFWLDSAVPGLFCLLGGQFWSMFFGEFGRPNSQNGHPRALGLQNRERRWHTFSFWGFPVLHYKNRGFRENPKMGPTKKV